MPLIFSPSKFVKALGLPFVCLAMFAVAGGHWAVLQSVAWGQMLVRYSLQEGSFWAGAGKTFSGEAPCSMCKKIAAAQTGEEKSPAPVSAEKKSDTTLVAFERLVPFPVSVRQAFFSVEREFFTRSEAPPAPVPIGRG